MKGGEDILVYSKNGNLIIESKIIRVREIISYQHIDDIIIKHVNEVYDHEMDIFLSQSVKYENAGNNLIHKILFQIFLLFHQNKRKVNISQSNEDLLIILNEIKSNLPKTVIPPDLDKSLFWKEVSDNHSFPLVKLVFSKNNLSLFEVLKKYNKYHEK